LCVFEKNEFFIKLKKYVIISKKNGFATFLAIFLTNSSGHPGAAAKLWKKIPFRGRAGRRQGVWRSALGAHPFFSREKMEKWDLRIPPNGRTRGWRG
jgi:hypothetical protein